VLGGALNALCSDALTRWGVPGAVVGVRGGGEADSEAFGVADLRTGAAVRPETTFRIASITKPFTAGGPPRFARLGGRLAERR
jgi:CubicO group peptidase (beta-lactamase class C family)